MMTTVSEGWATSGIKPTGGAIGAALFDLLLQLPTSTELTNAHPEARARAVAQSAGRRAAAVSGALALPPGPLGLLTIGPDLVAIWRIQQQMVVDIAAVFGRQAQLRREVMIYCLFKHGGAALLRDLVVRVGERVLVKEVTTRIVQQILRKVGIKVTQQVIGRGLARWIPVVGAIGTGAYAYFDTKQVAATAIAYFTQPLEGGGELTPPALPPALPTRQLPP